MSTEECTVQERLRYAASPDQNGQRISLSPLLLAADAEITRLSSALAAEQQAKEAFKESWAAQLQETKRLQSTISAHEATIAGLREALKRHHEWHLQSGEVGLPDGKGDWIAMDNAAEYSDSSLCEQTIAALASTPAQASAMVEVVKAAKEFEPFARQHKMAARLCDALANYRSLSHAKAEKE